MSTVQQIIDGGFAKSAAARPESFESPAELVSEVGMALRAVFQVLAQKNPYLIGVSVSVPFGGAGGWPRPVDCLCVLVVQANLGTISAPTMAVGAEIMVVPFDDQAFCAGMPSLTELGQSFIPTGQAIDPTGGTLQVVYARAPIIPAQALDAVDPFFPPQFDDYLKYDLAAYLAAKDSRADDETRFRSNQSALLQLIIDWAQAQTYSLQQRFPVVTAPLTNTDGGRQQPAKGA
jgi:hypothetical protein